ncbi:FAD-dependent oxidoreductase domain-containing protein 1 [Orchesella cincta]|uniref:FAD-dependent oxidoreductase domain-containing protein 1 n=1 Tax=Orchesella cincta TaxID=48709 RepID=A0A1D2NA94_ORCCI|nr:FAD-dependent oxidoreductase domain-containing protein 1 [Orchesella cincta]
MTGSLRKVASLAFNKLSKPTTISSIHGVSFPSNAYSTQVNCSQEIPSKCDVCIIGGGAMGSSTAFWLKQHPAGRALNVIVIERDPKYTKASTVLSLGGIRQQFSNAENIQLSLFGSEFLKRIQELLGVPDQPEIDVQYKNSGYLFIATTPEGAETLHENHALQRTFDSKVELLTQKQLKSLYPFMNVDDVVLASIGTDNEGWFDPWSLLNGFKRKALHLETQYVTGEVVGFETKDYNDSISVGPTQLHIRDTNGNIKSMEFSQCVVAGGYDSGNISKLAGIGTGNGILSTSLPVEPKKRYVYYFNAPSLASLKSFPLMIDSCGAYVRPEGPPGNFLTGRSPEEVDEPSCENLDVDYSFFDTHIWPFIASRVPDFENLKIKSAWGGYYDYNTFDQNGVIGTHPAFTNFHFATGFSGHGIQQSPAVGRALMEIILDGSYKTIDLTRFGFERFVEGRKVLEKNIV